MQYITKDEQNNLKMDPSFVSNFNRNNVCYAYAKALFSNIKVCLRDKEIEWSHDEIHNYFQMMMQDTNFSITSFIFFPYHSWIDLSVEMYLRRAKHGLTPKLNG